VKAIALALLLACAPLAPATHQTLNDCATDAECEAGIAHTPETDE